MFYETSLHRETKDRYGKSGFFALRVMFKNTYMTCGLRKILVTKKAQRAHRKTFVNFVPRGVKNLRGHDCFFKIILQAWQLPQPNTLKILNF